MSSTGIRRPRLLVLTSTYPRWKDDPEPGFVHELAKRLTDTFDVTVLGPHASGSALEEVFDGVRVSRYRYAPSRLETLVNDGGIITNLRRQPWKWLLVPGFLLSMMWSTWRAIRCGRPDAIHAHWLLPQGLVVALLQRLDRRVPPFLVTSHGADLFALRAKPLQMLKRFVVHCAAAATVVSNVMRDELVRIGADVGKVGVQPMGVDLYKRFTPDPRVPRSRDEILFVGRLVEKKGLRHLIDAMPMILQSHSSAYLTIAGFGPEAAERRAQVQRLGLQAKVSFVGGVPQAELTALYRRAAVFVAPFVQAASGDQEGLGLVVVEAAGCNCPVVTSDLPAVLDVFAGGAPAGMVPPGSVTALAEAVGAVLSGGAQRDAAVEQVRSSLCARFDWTVVARNYAEILRRLATGRIADQYVDVDCQGPTSPRRRWPCAGVGSMKFNRADDVLATITVTYNPDVEVLRKQLSQLPADAVRIVVDNASAPGLLGPLRALAEEQGAQLVINATNMGLASAANQGIQIARGKGCGSVLLLDQDTEPGAAGVSGLRAAYRRLLAEGMPPGCIGPRLIDVMTGLEHGFHRIRGWRWVREFPSPDAIDPVHCANLNGSGTLVPMKLFDDLGGLDDAMFIDHVDTEWSFRVLAAGFSLYGAPNVAFRHRMGERSLRFWFLRWRVWPWRSPLRHRYLFRNAVWLMHRDYVPIIWKYWAVAKLVLTMVVHLLFDSQRFRQVGGMLRGIRDGCRQQEQIRYRSVK